MFEAGFIPSDTDYRMFSAAKGQLGQWPGLDIAHILDSATYHTMQDTVGRIRPGILQVSPLFPGGCVLAFLCLGLTGKLHETKATAHATLYKACGH